MKPTEWPVRILRAVIAQPPLSTNVNELRLRRRFSKDSRFVVKLRLAEVVAVSCARGLSCACLQLFHVSLSSQNMTAVIGGLLWFDRSNELQYSTHAA